MQLGYNKPLYILPFDHRSTFLKKLFNADEATATPDQKEQVKELKQMVYEGFKMSLSVVPKEEAAILVDEEFGDAILRDAKEQGFTSILTTEKSGQEEFVFEYGDAFQAHINKYRPTFAKALIRFNPEADLELNRRQAKTLKQLSDFCHENGYKFLIEPLIPPTDKQLEQVGKEQSRFDKELRPQLTVMMIQQLQEQGVEPDIWKIEGMDKASDYEDVINQARSQGRNDVGVIILGRGLGQEEVENWLRIGAKVTGIVGFAIGRTIFWKPLEDYMNKTIDKIQAIQRISSNFIHFYHIYQQARRL